MNYESGFRPTMNNIIVNVSQGSTSQTSIKVNFDGFCDNDVSLRAEPNLSYIHIYFNPVVLRPLELRHGTSSSEIGVSTMTISADKNATTGDYFIPIVIEDSFNHEQDVKLKLIVTQGQLQAPIVTETPNISETPTVTEKPTLAETTTVAETPATTPDTKASTRMPDKNSILTFISIVSSFATIYVAYITYKDYRLRKNR